MIRVQIRSRSRSPIAELWFIFLPSFLPSIHTYIHKSWCDDPASKWLTGVISNTVPSKYAWWDQSLARRQDWVIQAWMGTETIIIINSRAPRSVGRRTKQRENYWEWAQRTRTLGEMRGSIESRGQHPGGSGVTSVSCQSQTRGRGKAKGGR